MHKSLIALTTIGSAFAVSSALAAGLSLTATGNNVPVSSTISTNYCAAAFSVSYDTTPGYVNSVTVSSSSADCNGYLYSIAFSGKPNPSLDGNSDPTTGTLAATSAKGGVTNGFKIVFAIPQTVSSIGNVTVTVAP